MPWKKVRDHEDCPSDKPVAVVKEDDGDLEGCHANEDDADAQIAALHAAEDDDEQALEPSAAWEAELAVEDEPTGDGRIIEAGALTWRELPLPLMFLRTTGGMGHEGAVVGGRIDRIERQGSKIMGYGVFDTGEDGIEAQRLVANRTLRGVSIDPDDIDAEIDCLDEDGSVIEKDVGGGGILLGLDEDEEQECADYRMRLVAGRISAATICPIPAIPSAEIRIAEQPAAVTASGVLDLPPAEWFDDPQFVELTPFTIEQSGRVYGHLARRGGPGSCYRGKPDICITAPHSPSEYDEYTYAARLAHCEDCDEPEEIPTGPIVIGTIHAPGGLSAAETRRHYEDTGMVVADVTAGDDAFGPWVAGALRPKVTSDQIIELRGASLSGDWRSCEGGLDLIAVLAVNVPGFPIPRPRIHVREGKQTALVAAVSPVIRHAHSRPAGTRLEDVDRRLRKIEAVTAALTPDAIERIAASIDRGDT